MPNKRLLLLQWEDSGNAYVVDPHPSEEIQLPNTKLSLNAMSLVL